MRHQTGSEITAVTPVPLQCFITSFRLFMCHSHTVLLLFFLYTINYLLEQLKIRRIVLFMFILVSGAHHFLCFELVLYWYHIPYVRTISFRHFSWSPNGNEFSHFCFLKKVLHLCLKVPSPDWQAFFLSHYIDDNYFFFWLTTFLESLLSRGYGI